MANSSKFRVKRRNYLLIGIVLGVISICGLFSTLIMYPYSVKTIIQWAMPIKPGSISRGMFLNLPFPLEFHCHIFNITNPKEVQNGEKPELEDIGPFVFYEHIIKHDEVDDELLDTLEYTLKKVWIYQPELSNGLTGEEQVTVLHPVISSLALTVNYNQRGFLKLISEVINEMFYKPTTPFWTGRAMDFLFDGIKIDCTSKKYQVRTICAIFASGDNPNVQPLVPNIPPTKQKYYVFSLLGAYNDSFSGRFKVMRGKRDVNDVGRIVSVDGKKRMRSWGNDEANEYQGTDGYFMPPFRSKKAPLWGFERMICVSLGLKYDRQTFIRGFPMPTFAKNFTEFASNKAYCRKNAPRTKKKKTYCPIEGTIDLFNCLNVPIVASLPHFLDSHPSLLENVKSGLSPNRDDHELSATLDLETGVPFRGIKRLQLNFEVLPVKEVQVMKQLRPMIFPLAWIEERAELPGLYITAMHCLFFFRLGVKGFEYLCLTLLPLAAMASISIHLMVENGSIEVIETPVSSVKMVGTTPDSIEKGEDANDDAASQDTKSSKSKKSSKSSNNSKSSKSTESKKSAQSTESVHSSKSIKNAKGTGSTENENEIKDKIKDKDTNSEPTENPEYSEISSFEKWLNANYGKWRGDDSGSSENAKEDKSAEKNN